MSNLIVVPLKKKPSTRSVWLYHAYQCMSGSYQFLIEFTMEEVKEAVKNNNAEGIEEYDVEMSINNDPENFNRRGWHLGEYLNQLEDFNDVVGSFPTEEGVIGLGWDKQSVMTDCVETFFDDVVY